MKFSKTLITITLTSVVVFITSCSKNNNTPPTTGLKIMVQNQNGNIISSATVSLYASNDDLLNGTNPLKTGVSDANGQVTFTGLSAIKYYFMVQSGCENNIANGDSTSSSLTLNTTSTALATIEGAGILKFVNTSANPYTIYINGTPVFVLNGVSTFTSPSIFPIGTYNLEVVQNSGYALYPTDEKFSGNLTCGGTLSTTFP